MRVQKTAKSPSRILTAALALGWAFDLLFYGRLPGLSVLLFVLLVISVLVGLGRLDGTAPKRQNLWLLVPLVFFAGMVAVRANPILSVLNGLACVLLLALLAYFYSAGRLDRLGLLGYYFTLAISMFNGVFRAAPLLSEGLDVQGLKRRSAKSTQTLLPILRGLLLALPVAIVFTALLASADVVFAGWIGALFSMQLPNLQEALWHIVIVLTVAWVLAGGLAFAISRGGMEDGEPWEQALDTVPRIIHIGFVEGAVVLSVVDLIFLAFGWIQLSYLFGGSSNITLDGFTYADYARRGFFELVAVSVLTLGLILALHSFTWRETRLHNTVFKILSSTMVALTFVLLTSAFYRMWMYEEAYGFTELRLAVHVFEVWLALLFGWFLVTLWAVPKRFAVGAFVAVLGCLATLNLMNVDAVIAERNLARYAESGKIDLYYLSELSEDGVPVLLANIRSLEPDDQARLLSSLRARWQEMKSDDGWKSIPSYNLGRWEAYNALESNVEALLRAPAPVGSLDGDRLLDEPDR